MTRTSTVLLATGLLLLGGNLGAYAATGQPLLAGGSNRAGSPTFLRNTGTGPALALHTDTVSPPLAVSSSVKVPHLNADLLDGVRAGALQTRATDYTLMPSSTKDDTQTVIMQADPGFYLASYTMVLLFDKSETHQGVCAFDSPGANGLGADFLFTGETTIATAQGTAQVVVPASGQLKLICETSDPFTILSEQNNARSSIDMVPLARVNEAHAVVVTGNP